jgi:hypothetical protein
VAGQSTARTEGNADTLERPPLKIVRMGPGAPAEAPPDAPGGPVSARGEPAVAVAGPTVGADDGTRTVISGTGAQIQKKTVSQRTFSPSRGSRATGASKVQNRQSTEEPNATGN